MIRRACFTAAVLATLSLSACVTGSMHTVTCPNTDINVSVPRSIFLHGEDQNVWDECQKAVAAWYDRERAEAAARNAAEHAAREAAATAQPAQCEMLGDFQLTFQHTLDAIAAQAIIHANGRTSGPFWSKPTLGDAKKTQWAIGTLENNHSPNVLADMMNTTAPVPHDADRSAFFRQLKGKQQLILFGRAECAVSVVVINPDLGVFSLSPSRYLFVPGGGVVVLGR